MKHIVLLNGENGASAGALREALRAAGVAAWVAAANGDEAGTGAAAVDGEPLAVLCEIQGGAELGALRAAALRAFERWPGVPLVACRAVSSNGARNGEGQQLEAGTLRRLGFRAVADDPAQLPALLREIEERGQTGDLTIAEEESVRAATSPALPGEMDAERTRAAFAMVAALHFAGDQRSAAATALDGLEPLIFADRWTLYLRGDARGTDEAALEPLAVRGGIASEQSSPDDEWRQALLGDALALTPSLAVRTSARTVETLNTTEEGRRILALPLISGERVVGVLEAVRARSDENGSSVLEFSSAEVELLVALSAPVAAALANSSRIAEAERLSQTDDLTKLRNARFLRQYLTSEIKRARRYGSSVTALFLDLDDFKRVNDEQGHLVGSHILMELAAVILASVRDTDVVARYGGDEFVIVLPETGLELATRVAERVRERMAAHAFTGGRRLSLRLSASFGVASFPVHAQSPQQLVARADAAMYEAKAAGKNCVRLAEG